MISDRSDIPLYHASYTIVKTIDLSACKKRNDFGRGFYLTTDSEQAEKFVKTSILKAGQNLKFGYVNLYRMSNFDGLKCYEFIATDKEWLHCVCSYRRTELFPNEAGKWEHYDILIGKIANDYTMSTLAIYLANGYGEVGSEAAIDTAVGVLKPERLKDQVCLKTERAISKIVYAGSYKVAIK